MLNLDRKVRLFERWRNAAGIVLARMRYRLRRTILGVRVYYHLRLSLIHMRRWRRAMLVARAERDPATRLAHAKIAQSEHDLMVVHAVILDALFQERRELHSW